MESLRVFEAESNGQRCGICGEPINAGDLVVYVDDEICHADCAQEEGYDIGPEE